MKARVYHTSYGCDSGCCGHVVELEDGRNRFEFTHPPAEEAREFVEDVIRQEWPDCLSLINWDSLEVDLSDD